MLEQYQNLSLNIAGRNIVRRSRNKGIIIRRDVDKKSRTKSQGKKRRKTPEK